MATPIHRAIIVTVCLAVIGIGASCGRQTSRHVVASSATSSEMVAITPSPTNTSKPVEILLPTLTPTLVPTSTPVPPIDPDAAFLEWLDDNGYEFLVDVRDGSKRYQVPDSDLGIVVDVSSDSVLSWDTILEEGDIGPVLYEIMRVTIGAIESHGMDTSALTNATNAPYTLPLLLQGEDYSVVIKSGNYSLTSQVTFME